MIAERIQNGIPFIDRVIDAARVAGKIIEDVRREGFTSEDKGDLGPVTRADRSSDSYLKRKLLALEDCGWLSEETGDDGSRLERSRLWVVDPLDGTKEFVAGIPEYAVSIGLVEDGAAVLGVIHNPVTGETCWAERGQGAFLDGSPIHVNEGEVILASNSETKRGEFAPFQSPWRPRNMGSIAYKLACIAAGHAAITLSRGPKWEWDVCAGGLIVQEAGGLATDVYGGPLVYNRSFAKVKGILAGAPEAHGRAAGVIATIGASDRMAEFGDVPIEGRPGGASS